MATRSESADLCPLVSRGAAREAFCKALSLYVGYRGSKRRYTMAQLETGTGIKARVIESAMEDPDGTGYRNLPAEAILSLCAFLGPKFTSEWLAEANQAAFALGGEGGSDEVIDDLAEEADELAAEVRRARSPRSPGGQKILPSEHAAIQRRGRNVVSLAHTVTQ